MSKSSFLIQLTQTTQSHLLAYMYLSELSTEKHARTGFSALYSWQHGYLFSHTNMICLYSLQFSALTLLVGQQACEMMTVES